MPNIPDQQAPTVGVSGPPANDYLRVDSSPADFGGLQGAALQRAGGQVEQGAGDVMQAAVALQQRHNQLAVTNGFNNFQSQLLSLTGGDPNVPGDKGYLGTTGGDALNGYQTASEAIASLRDQEKGKLQNDAQRLEFDDASRRLQIYTLDTMRSHYLQQSNVYAAGLNTATMNNQQRAVAVQPANDTAFNNSVPEVYTAAVRRAHDQFGGNPDPGIVQNEMAKATTGLVKARIDAWAPTDPGAALNWLQNGQMPGPVPGQMVPVRTSVDPAVYDEMYRQLQSRSASTAGKSIADETWNSIGAPGSGTGGQPAGLDAATVSRARLVHDSAVRQGASDAAGWGVAANAVHESGATTAPTPGDGGISHGMFQLNRGQLAAYQSAHGGQMPEQGSIDDQVGFVLNRAGQLPASNDPGDHAAAISRQFEVPRGGEGEAQNRAATARALAANAGGGSAAPNTAPSVPASQMVAVGDSIAVLAQRRNGYAGGGVVGANPDHVLDQINAMPLGSLAGKPVVLSTGLSNAGAHAADPAQLAIVQQQLDGLNARGATDIRILGVGDAKFPGANSALQQIADRNGATFTGPLTNLQPDGVHPANATGLGMTGAPAPVPGASGGQNYPDESGGIQRIIDRTAGMPQEVRDTAISAFKQRVGVYELQTATQRSGIQKQYADTLGALEAGKSDVIIPEDRIRAVFPPAAATDMVQHLAVARSVGQIFAGVQWATPDGITAMRDDLSSGMGVHSDMLRASSQKGVAPSDQGTGMIPSMTMPVGTTGERETPEQFGFRQKVLERFNQMVDQRAAALRTDPAGYVASAPPVAARIAALDPKNPATQEDYARATLAAQTQVGVPEQNQHILTVQQATQAAGKLTNADPATADVGALMDQTAKQYGYEWPRAFGDLVTLGRLPGDYQLLGAMPAGPDRMQMQRALQVSAAKGGVENMRKDIDPVAAQGIDRDVDGLLDQFRKTVMIPGLAGNAPLFSTVRNAVRTSALYGVLTGQGASDALTKAAAGALPYDYSGAGLARAPIGMAGAADQFGAQLVAGLTPDAIGAPRTANTDLTPDQAKQAYVAAVQRHGVWVTNERDDGWSLAVPTEKGGYQLVTRPDGNRVEFRFADLPKGGSTPPIVTPAAPPILQ